MPVPVLVRNNEAGPLVFTDPTANVEVRWEGAGDPAEGDVQIVPQALLENANFLRALTRGLVEIVNLDEHPQMEKRLARLSSGALGKQREAADKARSNRWARTVPGESFVNADGEVEEKTVKVVVEKRVARETETVETDYV